MNAAIVRGFLIQKPKPSRVRCTIDGETREFGPKGKSWAHTAETIIALQPELIELLGPQGDLLRAMRGVDASEAPMPESDEVPIQPALRADPQALMLTHFADLIHRAYKHSTETAFTKMVELVDRMNDRSTSIEERLERAEAQNRKLANEQVEDAFERAEEVAAAAGQAGQSGELVQQLAGAFLSGQLQKKGESPPPNGKGH
jgi:hypothetical protein